MYPSGSGGESAMAVPVRKHDDFLELRQALADLPLHVEEREFAEVASAFLKRHEDRFRFSGRSEPLSEAETDALRSVGVVPGAAMSGAAPVLQAAASHAALVATALPIAEAARRLGVTDGRLRQRVAEGSLLAVHGARRAGAAHPGLPAHRDGGASGPQARPQGDAPRSQADPGRGLLHHGSARSGGCGRRADDAGGLAPGRQRSDDGAGTSRKASDAEVSGAAPGRHAAGRSARTS